MKNIIKCALALMLTAACLILTSAALADTTHICFSWCTDADPTVCCICGKGGIDFVWHRTVKATDTGHSTHVSRCQDCKLAWEEDHRVLCTDADRSKCRLCGAAEDIVTIHAPENIIIRSNNAETHSEYCTACGSTLDTWHHEVLCTAADKNTCNLCGAWCDVEPSHPYDQRQQEYVDRETHVEVCGACHASLGFCYWHTVPCNATDFTVCIECGGRGEMKIVHTLGVYVNIGDGMHSNICEGCGEVFDTDYHHAYCTNLNKNTCAYCNYYDENMPVYHAEELIYVDNGNGTHSKLCPDCGEVFSTDLHNTSCMVDDRTVCERCGASDQEVIVRHINQLYTDNGDGTHTSTCPYCKEKVYTSEHYVWCDGEDLTVCMCCGAKNPVIYHDYVNGFCLRCGGAEPSTDDRKTAVMKDGLLGYEENGEFILATGLVPFEGGLFLVDSGDVLTDKNGLSKTEKGWYYFAGGQAQTQYTGFVQYDGAWFYVTGGLMDTVSNGLYDYDGSKFLVSAGQVRYDYSGLFQNAAGNLHNADGKWYFIAGGQVQTQYTGLAQYDGHWFYLVGGVLAESYTGTVEYNGGLFQVVNGMVI